MHRSHHVLAVFALLAIAAPVQADIIEMSDGRRFEGEILAERPDGITIDTRVTPTIRTKITLPRDAISSVVRKPLPSGFFDPPPAAPRVSAPDAFEGGVVFLEVPIHGRFGEQVFASAVVEALRYARRYRLGHVVFDIDSTGGDLAEIEATYEQLRRHHPRLTFHAIVRQCVGGAMAVALWCDTIHLVPGAVIGGSAEPLSSTDRGQEDSLVRAQIASEVIRETRLEHTEADIVRAMIDPFQSLASWRAGDEIFCEPDPPAEVPDGDIIFQVGPGRLLQLDYEQGLLLGLVPFEGGASDLGSVLGYDSWQRESDFGARAMAKAVGRHEREAEQAAAQFADVVEENIRRRGMLERRLEESLKQVAEWNPDSGQYEYYSRRWGWGWRSNRVRMSAQSRQRWAQRTDLALGYLQQAAQCVVALERLDRQAIELGLEPAFEHKDFAWMRQDIQTKYDYLAANRNVR